ncbi:hypothetical protein CW731_04095 [Polaribacter sp. ALD11]|uniref:hypothetical protein n=1 Tax=Polaribacter sp. ALD11 TaxID=2058137 RepID=UPI000C31750B|nr:hypothetical protein [Polaribacter sp. ALD11]AUC84530.1 hypothetical protein CW731_04095 [Polaribacter sp. ALD11]
MKKMKTNYLKLGALGLMMLVGTAVNAQQTSGTDALTGNAVGAFEKKGQSSELNGTVRVIDNKGTKKYLQVKNGLTLLTDVQPDGGIVSTWQLGGTLTDDTNIATGDKEFKITLDTGGTFLLNGAGLLRETGTAATATTLNTSGFTLLVRDEGTGEVKKMLATDFITAGRTEFPIPSDGAVAVTATGLAMGTSINKISVYRNGAKLRAGVDYTLTADDTITLDISAGVPNDWTTYTGDIIEVQWIY